MGNINDRVKVKCGALVKPERLNPHMETCCICRFTNRDPLIDHKRWGIVLGATVQPEEPTAGGGSAKATQLSLF